MRTVQIGGKRLKPRDCEMLISAGRLLEAAPVYVEKRPHKISEKRPFFERFAYSFFPPLDR
jgi:hypothetical protein